MSEPIQSISQGNYILQGTVATSAGIVGDGSTQNPLRADETVLYDNTNPTAVTSNTSVNLSESYLNFKELKLYLQASFGSTENMNYVVTTFVSQDGITEIGSMAITNTQSAVLCDSNCYVFYSTEPLVCYIKSNGARVNMEVGSTNVTNNRGAKLYKVIGVNRIANN